MHPNPAFHTKQDEQNLAFAAARSFGVLTINGAEAPLVSHVPFLIEEGWVRLHLVRSNPIVRALTEPRQACIAVIGPDSYISPDWYEVEDQVPTWNYIAVHLRGKLELLPQDELHAMLDRQSSHFEGQLAPKKPWTTDKMSDGVMEKMMRAIVPCQMRIEAVDGTWKLGQNKPDAVRLRAAGAVAENGIGTDLETLAAHMRAP
jgi:transcriptional regulator